MRTLRYGLLLLFILASITACEDDPAKSALKRGLTAYNAKNYAKAYRQWLPVAEVGNAHGQYWIGRLFDDGKGVKRDDAVATSWYRKAAEQGHAAAQYRLGLQIGFGYGVAKEADQALQHKEAAKWFRASAEQGYAKAQGELCYYYRQGRGVPRSNTEAVKWCKKGAAQGDNWSLYLLAEFQSSDSYRHESTGVASDDDAAVKNYLKAALNGDYWSAQNLERLFFEGRTSLSAADIVQLFEQLASRPANTIASGHLAQIYLQGRLTDRDTAKAIPLLERAVKDGFWGKNASYQLAKMYLAGDGVRRNTAKAAELLRTVESHVRKARLRLAFLYANGDGVHRDIAQAYYWASLAALPEKDPDLTRRALQARSLFESQMSAEEIVNGKKLIQDRLARLSERSREYQARLFKKVPEASPPQTTQFGEEGLRRLVASGKLRHADKQDIQIWQDSAGKLAASKPSALTRLPLDRIYVVTASVVLPDGLIGSQSVTFLLATGAPVPTGPQGDNLFYSMTDFKCQPHCGFQIPRAHVVRKK